MRPQEHNFFGEGGRDVRQKHVYNADEQTRAIFLTDGLKPPGRVSLNGVWLGDVCEDFRLSEILNQVFGPQTLAAWQKQVGQQALGESRPRRIFTLRQMIFFGIVVRAIEQKVSAAWTSMQDAHRVGDYDIRLRFIRPGDKGSELQLDWTHASHAGLQFVRGESGQGRIILNNLSLGAVRKLSRWITRHEDDATGFFHWYFTPPRVAAWMTIRRVDLDVLTEGRLCITPSELTAIRDLQEEVSDSLAVDIRKTEVVPSLHGSRGPHVKGSDP